MKSTSPTIILKERARKTTMRRSSSSSAEKEENSCSTKNSLMKLPPSNAKEAKYSGRSGPKNGSERNKKGRDK